LNLERCATPAIRGTTLSDPSGAVGRSIFEGEITSAERRTMADGAPGPEIPVDQNVSETSRAISPDEFGAKVSFKR